MSTDRTAPTEHPIIDVLSERWSPRAFDATAAIDEAALNSALEAARWAPSGYNAQPWRFIVARRGTAEFDKIVATMVEFNQQWASRASVLIVAIAEVTNAEGKANGTASYDLGQAIAHFSVQAHAEGLYTHQMSGFRPADLAAAFELDERFTPVTLTAVGTLGTTEGLPDMIVERETAPRERRALAESILINA